MATTSSSSANSAIDLLKTDHEQVRQLFDQFESLAGSGSGEQHKMQLVQQICSMLTVHTTIEEELLYPAAKSSIEEPDLVDEATVEHASAKDLIVQIKRLSPGDELYDAKVKVLGEYVKHHVSEEEGELFPQLEEAGLDLQSLGQQLAARKQELMSQEQAASAGA